jgi:hypothetical protein
VRCCRLFRLGEFVDFLQGKYEYEYGAEETSEYNTTPNYQEYGTSNTPGYAPTPVASDQSALGTSNVAPDHDPGSVNEATAAFGNLDLSKGKERAAGI